MKPTVLVMSCEHSVNKVPEAYMHLFHKRESVLNSSRAMDFGALDVTRQVSHELNCQFTQSKVSRLLIDCNRSLAHGHCFSKFTRHLSDSQKKELIDHYYTPFREETVALIEKHRAVNEQVLHVSIHTFKPFLKGLRQNAGIGLLYHSERHAEKEVARIWHGLLLQETPSYRVRLNYPFRGRSDSFTQSLRHQYIEQDYLGIEMEINQAILASKPALKEMAHAISHSLNELLLLL